MSGAVSSSLKNVIPDSDSEFTEEWTERHPDPEGRRTEIQLRINDSTIQELQFVHLDGRRILVPMPRQVFVSGSPEYFWERDSIEFKVCKIVGRYYIHKTLEGVGSHSGVSIVSGRN
ncbi:hypothetical protein WAB97_011585 [Stenotrophomonas maltophilia]